ncbi:hypothetical protein [Streptomyces goshikiensis]
MRTGMSATAGRPMARAAGTARLLMVPSVPTPRAQGPGPVGVRRAAGGAG